MPLQDEEELFDGSHPTRGAWIEILNETDYDDLYEVAPHTGCVD